MGNIVYVLLVEDSVYDAELIIYNLQKSGIAAVFERVCNEGAMRDALSRKEWNIILSDHLMPSFNSIDALTIRNELCSEVPFIIVSSCIDENLLNTASQMGCAACVPKSSLYELGELVKCKLGLS